MRSIYLWGSLRATVEPENACPPSIEVITHQPCCYLEESMPHLNPGEEAAWKALDDARAVEICQKSLARFDEVERCYLLRILGDDFAVVPSERTIKCVSGKSVSIDLNFRLMTLVYLTNAKKTEPTGKLVQASQLRGGESFFRGVHSLPVGELESRFGRCPGDLRKACLALEGRPVPFGDLAMELRVLPKVPLTIVLWVADDEFPARVSILFDSTVQDHLPLDAVLATVHATSKRILACG